jgi:ribosomal protein S18 acetylase RimI-like enzyme
MPPSLVPVVPSDREAFLRMATAHFTELSSAFVPQDDWKQTYFETILANPQLLLRWIVSGTQRAGFILFGIENHRFLPRKTGVVYELYVVPEFRRRGLARSCAVQAIEALWQFGPSKIQLEVVDGNERAAALWESLGFRRVTVRFVLTRSKS